MVPRTAQEIQRALDGAIARAVQQGLTLGSLGLPDSSEPRGFKFIDDNEPQLWLVRIFKGISATPAKALNYAVPAIGNLPILLRRTRQNTLMIIGVDEELTSFFLGSETFGVGAGPHDHNDYDHGLWNYVDSLRFEPGLIVANDTNLTVTANPFMYYLDDGTDGVWYAGATQDLTSDKPGTSTDWVWVLVSLDKSTGALRTDAGTATAQTNPLALSSLAALIDTSVGIPLGGVKLKGDATLLTYQDIFDARMFLQTAESGGSGGGIDPELVYGSNLVKNYPSYELADGAQPEWWEVTDGTLTEEDATGESIVQKFERVLELRTSASNGYIYQPILSAENSIDNGVTKLSASCWVYQKEGEGTPSGTITLRLRTSGGTVVGSATTTTVGSWVFLKVENQTHTANLRWEVAHSANGGDMYVAMPMLNVGEEVLPWRPRGIRWVDCVDDQIVFGQSPPDTIPTSWTDYDATSDTSELAVCVYVQGFVSSTSNAQNIVMAGRRNGSSDAFTTSAQFVYWPDNAMDGTTEYAMRGLKQIYLDDGQVFEYSVSSSAESWAIYLLGYWEWES